MANKNEEDFWNESSSSGFNFFDEEDDMSLTESDVFSPSVQDNSPLPVHSVISNKCLNAILDDVNSAVENVIPPDEAVRRMFLGHRFSLYVYHTLEEKLLLLDTAIAIADGNIILTVILFLKKTLKSNIFLYQLSKRKIAARHYISYVIEKNNLQELADFYMGTGNVSDLKDIYYLLNKDTSNPEVLYKKLGQFAVEHANVDFKSEIQDNISFLKWLIENKSQSESLVEELIKLCENDCAKKHEDFAMDFKKKFKIDDFQYEWIIMCVLCKLKSWDKLLNTFVKTIWVLKKRSLKSNIRTDLFIMNLGKYKAPSHVIEQFLPYIGDINKSLFLAEKFGAHLYVIKHYIDQKDKGALLKYTSKVDMHGEEMRIIQNALNNSDINWKN